MRRLMLASALAASIALAMPAHAGAFSYADPADMPADGGLDIRSVTYSTAGSGQGKKFIPSTLVATMELGAAPVARPGVGFEVSAQVAECGDLIFSYTPGTVGSAVLGEALLFVGCGGTTDPTSDAQILTPKFAVDGSKLTWSVAIKTLPKEIRIGAELTDLVSRVDIVEPAFGTRLISAAPGAFDTASTDKTWRIS